MAEGLLRHLAGDRFEVFSAGTHPAGVNPRSAQAMNEIGIDISGHRSKNVSEFSGQEFDYAITVCDSARQACPIFPGKTRKRHWEIEDPATATGSEDQIMDAFRQARHKLRSEIEKLLREQP